MLMMGCEIKSVTSNKTAHEVIKLLTILKILLQIKFLRQTLFALFSTVIGLLGASNVGLPAPVSRF